jgi:hypothetical protein
MSFLDVGIAIDQLANALVGGKADETLSARAHRQRLKGRYAAASFIDALFFWQQNHCERAYESERNRTQLPKDYQ